MKTCISFMKAITSIKELNIALEHETDDKEEGAALYIPTSNTGHRAPLWLSICNISQKKNKCPGSGVHQDRNVPICIDQNGILLVMMIEWSQYTNRICSCWHKYLPSLQWFALLEVVMGARKKWFWHHETSKEHGFKMKTCDQMSRTDGDETVY